MDGGTDELIEHLPGLEVQKAVVGVADEESTSFQQPGHSLGDAVQQLRELGGSRPERPVEFRPWTIE